MSNNLKYTVKVGGKETVVPITYSFEAGYYVYRAPSYRITVSKTVRTSAWSEFVEKLTSAVAERQKNRL
jgi:hypothetical protein